MARRNDLDIIADILQVAINNGGAKKTHLVYGANLNFNIIKKYLVRMHELLEFDENTGLWFVTDKGRQFLTQYKMLIVPMMPEGVTLYRTQVAD